MADEHYFRGNGKTCSMCGLYPHAPTHVQEQTDEQKAPVERLQFAVNTAGRLGFVEFYSRRDEAVVLSRDIEAVLAALRDVREQRDVAEQFAMALGITPVSELEGIAKERYERWLQRVSDRMDTEEKSS